MVGVSFRFQHSKGHQLPSVYCLRTALTLMLLASVARRRGAELMGKARDVALSRAAFARRKAEVQAGVQAKGSLGNFRSVRGLTREARPGSNLL